MQRNCLVASVFSVLVLVVGFACESKPSASEETQILKITVGQPTKLSELVNQNTANLMVSRTGVVAVFYPKPRTGPKFYRVSTDGGHTWSPEMNGPPELGGGADSGTLRDGGVIMPVAVAASTNYTRAEGWKGDPDPNTQNPEGLEEGRYDALFLRFPDDMLSWDIERVTIHAPANVLALGHVLGPSPAKGKIIQMANGDLLMPVQGCFKADRTDRLRSYLLCSSDQGRTWSYYATIDYTPEDPNPELPGHYLGSCEPSIELLPNGQMLAMLRTQYSHVRGEYRPMSVRWSDDLGKTWTRPVPTKPYLMNISPTLQVLDNGVVACQYGRPGFHVAFSIDNGHTWQDRVSFSDLPCGVITGQFDMIKVGPNKLVAVGNDAEGTKVWPIKVERVKVSPARVPMTGRVLDQQGNPIAGAKVELSPNRYTADDWSIVPAYKSLPNHYLESYFEERVMAAPPVLAYRSIQAVNHHPTVQSDAKGRFQFDNVGLGEYVLTVEADGYAPQHRHIKVGPEAKPHDFRLKAGQKVCNRVMDNTGQPVPGACVVLNRWHTHTDLHGFFHWSVEAPLPAQVEMKVYRRYSGRYETLKATLPFSQLERKPIILPRKR